MIKPAAKKQTIEFFRFYRYSFLTIEYKMNKEDIVEIDSVEELVQIDSSYSEGSN